MKRRQFLQPALAALLVPRIDLRKQIGNSVSPPVAAAITRAIAGVV